MLSSPPGFPRFSRFLRDAGAELSEHSGAAGTAALLTGRDLRAMAMGRNRSKRSLSNDDDTENHSYHKPI